MMYTPRILRAIVCVCFCILLVFCLDTVQLLTVAIWSSGFIELSTVFRISAGKCLSLILMKLVLETADE